VARFPKSVSAGDPIPTGSEAWNAILGAAHEHRQAGRPDAPPARGGYGGVVWALGLNDTGANIPKHKPVRATGVGGLDVGGSDPDDDGGPPWQRRPLLTLSAPAAVTDWVCVTLDAIPAGEIGRVAVSGLTLCDVDSASGATWAAPQVGDTAALLGGSTGTVRVLHVPSGVGSQRRCVVYLHERPAPAAPAIANGHVALATDTSVAGGLGGVVQTPTLPAGEYLLWADAVGELNSPTAGASMNVQLYGAFTLLADLSVVQAPVAGQTALGCSSTTAKHSSAIPWTARLDASGTPGATVQLLKGSGGFRRYNTRITWLKVG
jgi:hypothetical protein